MCVCGVHVPDAWNKNCVCVCVCVCVCAIIQQARPCLCVCVCACVHVHAFPQAFLNEAVDHATEGLIVKTMDGTYEPSKRSNNWLKARRTHTHTHIQHDTTQI